MLLDSVNELIIDTVQKNRFLVHNFGVSSALVPCLNMVTRLQGITEKKSKYFLKPYAHSGPKCIKKVHSQKSYLSNYIVEWA